ncbi:MAG: tripartite tricarboxylate transporter substrate binding protein [Betaproteobacteria bacterium]|nr:tripartite tricarboxylate transporter substrate binding protein [Betaproteobacteria bacterium]
MRIAISHSGFWVWCALMLPIAAVGHAAAQGYPEKPIRFIVPAPPGGGANIVARVIGQKLSDGWGQQVVVDNRGGAGGIIGTELAAKAEPDGYTLLLGLTANLSFAPSLFRNLPYDTTRDFAPVTLVGSTPYVLVVNPSIPVKSVKELIALARSRPGKLNFASTGNGAGNHLAGELFKNMTGVNLVHVPYKGGGQALTAVLSGEAQLIFGSMLSTLPHVKADKLRALAITGAKRSSAAPDVPTIAEAGVPGYDVTTWQGVLVPARTPKKIIARLHAEFVKILRMPDVRQRLSGEGFDLLGGTPGEFGKLIKADIEKWAKVVKQSGIRID